MDLSIWPDQRATADPLGPLADDTSDLNNAEFLDAAERMAATLQSRGVSAGEVVAIKLPNAAEFVGPPATKDLLGITSCREAVHELRSMVTAIRDDNEFDLTRLRGLLKVARS